MGGQRIGVIGGGILGLAVARELASARHADVTVLEKEDRLAAHQTGHNSGVVHAGIYYEPGSLKARLCREGVSLLKEYCQEHGIPYVEAGKLVIAARPGELDGLRRISERARANGVPDISDLGPSGLKDIEPHAVGLAAVHSPRTAIVDFTAVAERLAQDIKEAGGGVRLRHEVTGIAQTARGIEVTAGGSRTDYDLVVACAGLQTDGVARLAGQLGDVRIIPFRGEYFRLARPDLVNGLIYPVPDPRYPFLGIHLTKRIDGAVLVGPNAVLGLSLEPYGRRDVRPRELWSILGWPGTRALARRHWRTGIGEVAGSLSKRLFLSKARRYVPSLTPKDLVRALSGVRAQAVDRRGNLLDDFAIDVQGRLVLVRNAPSPAATSSLAIARHIAALLPSSP